MIKLSSKNKRVVEQCLAKWQTAKLIDDDTASQLKNTLHEENETYKSLSVFAFIVAISSVLLALFTILEAKWLEQIITYFSWGALTVGLVFLFLTVTIVWVRYKKGTQYTQISIEMLHIAIIICLAIGLTYIYKYYSPDYEYYYIVFVGLAINLVLVSKWIKSLLLWLASIISIMIGGTIAIFEHYDASRALLNIPFQMLLLTMMLWALYRLFKNYISLKIYHVSNTILVASILFMGWLCSIYGNVFSYDVWLHIWQGNLWIWAVLYTLILGGLLFVSFQKRIPYLRDLSLAFLVLSVYTRYFEYFWDYTNKALFFVILALSCWWVGKKIEQIRARDKDFTIDDDND
jgi:hypothetical protein